MKKKMLPLAIAAAIAAPGVALADGPTVYGKFNVSYENADYSYDDGSTDDSADTWELNSNASRVGVKGEEKINDGLSAFYQAEYGMNVDDGSDGREYGIDIDDDGDDDVDVNTSQTLTQRDIFVGLKGGWGAVQLGKFDTPLKKSQGKVDQFNDLQAGDISELIVGENRESNLIQYSSPTIADALVLNLAFQPGEEYCSDGAASDCQDGPAENFSASAVFDSSMIYAAVAMDDGIAGWDATRLTVMGKLDMFEVGLIYQTAEEAESDTPDEEDGYILSAGMKLGSSNKIKAQYGNSEYDQDVTGTTWTFEGTQFGLGFDHYLSKQTTLFANYIMLEYETTAEGYTGSIDEEENRLQFGIVHNF